MTCRMRRMLAAACLLSAGAHAAQPEQKSVPPTRQYAAAEQAFQSGDLAHAEDLYSKILEAHGDAPFAWFRVGVIQQRGHSFRAALNAYDNALACAPSDASDAIVQVLAKVRFNRALLLLENASRDLKDIPRGALPQDLDLTREALTARVDAAMRSADADGEGSTPPGIESAALDGSGAKGYLYEAPVVAAHPVPSQRP